MSRSRSLVSSLLIAVIIAALFVVPAFSQSESASISGLVTDPSGAVVAGASVRLTDIDRDTSLETESNSTGLYLFPSVHPGRYRLEVTQTGFRVTDVTGLVINTQDALSENIRLEIGSVSESVTVDANRVNINTTDGSVSTVVDRKFVENMPLNGRSFQTLIQLTPGVVTTPSTSSDGGQFSVNGQRPESNYWMVDGVSGNIGVSSSLVGGNGFGGALGSFSAMGGTNSLVSVDALQEFRIQTSTYAPEFGRTPGGQISIVTRSGTNQFHGTAFDYFRNDALDANDWFNGTTNPALPKARERQNDFGGTFSGPIVKDRTFFFFSYEGLRLRLPQTTLSTVPDLNARQNASSALQPFLNAYPKPNGADNPATGTAQFNASFSNPSRLDASSVRIDHRLNDKLSLFARYNYSPSEIVQRGGGNSLNTVIPSLVTTQTGTLGSTWGFSTSIINDLRFNYSRTNASSRFDIDNFGGAVPLTSLPLPGGLTSKNATLSFFIFSLTNGTGFNVGHSTKNLQRQINVVDNLSLQKGSHSFKFGIDFRRLSPLSEPYAYRQAAFFLNVPSAETGNLFLSLLLSSRRVALAFKNLGVFGQDTWRVNPSLTVTYGLRWDVDFAPSSTEATNLPGVTGYDLKDLSKLALAPGAAPPFSTNYSNVAPRVGLAYQMSQNQNWQTVLRGGFGVFYDLVTSQAGNDFNSCCYPFGSVSRQIGGSFPLAPAAAAPPPIAPPNASNSQILFGFDPQLRLPYTLEWNVALEQALGKQQTISASYIGSAGRRLLQTADVILPNANLAEAHLIANTATSDYSALQLQFNRRLSRGLQVLASYTWSHSIDDGSAGSSGEISNELAPMLNSNANRGPSDYDIRHAFSTGFTYEVPQPKMNEFSNAVLRGWSVQNVIQARSAPPVDVSDVAFSQIAGSAGQAVVRPDLVPGQPLYLYAAQCIAVLGPPCAGGRGLNPSAFTDPPVDPISGLPLRQGNLGRNALRGFGAIQWDFAVHRNFPIHESLALQFRAEMFNVLNHPNFGPPSGFFGSGSFGTSTQMLGQFFNGGNSGEGNLGGGSFSPLYQMGGPRSIQFALKLIF